VAKLTQLNDVTYLGSHPHALSRVEGLDLCFTTEGLQFGRGDETLGQIPWNRVISLSADARDEVERRITALRVLLLGALSIVFRKTRRFASFDVTDADGVWSFAVQGITAAQLREGLAQLKPYVGGRMAPINPP
jgi:hypothetical protein